MRYVLILLLVFEILAPIHSAEEVIPDNRREVFRESVRVEGKELGNTFGFLISMHELLRIIERQYPSLSLYAQKSELEFQGSFGKAEKNITQLLNDVLKEEYQEFHASIVARLNSILEKQALDYDNAVNFISEVELWAKGEMPSPMRETVLHYQFEDNPVGELIQGFKQLYSTKGHRKSKGLHLQLEYPLSWSSREGKRPNIIQFFRSYNGKGRAYASIAVKDMIKEAREDGVLITSKEAEMIKTREGAMRMAKDFASNIAFLRGIADSYDLNSIRDTSVKMVTVDSWPGVVFNFIGDAERVGVKLTVYARVYIAIYKNYMIFLVLNISKEAHEPEDVLKTAIQKYTPLFDLIANSLVIMDQYHGGR
jgi:hypothetical protein